MPQKSCNFCLFCWELSIYAKKALVIYTNCCARGFETGRRGGEKVKEGVFEGLWAGRWVRPWVRRGEERKGIMKSNENNDRINESNDRD